MSNMDEISFWITTKKAPCLFSIASVSGSKANSVHSCAENLPSPKKKKRKLTILDDESVLSEKQHNLYFDASQIKNRPVNGCDSSTASYDIDFNIKKSSVQEKRKNSKLQRNARTTLHKKNKLVTSTPKPQVLRRSLRKVQSNHNNNTSYDIYNTTVHYDNSQIPLEPNPERACRRDRKSTRDQTVPNKSSREMGTHPIVANDKYEDLSDVSGFTANYIRSTKINSKTPRKIKSKASRNLMKESFQSPKEESRMVICVNKGVSTGLPQDPILNCSTDSSQNVINLVTIKGNSKAQKVDKGTSLLKFIEGNNVDTNLDCSKDTNIDSVNSKTSTSRYPKRNKATNLMTINEKPNVDKKRKVNNNSMFDESDRKENPNDKASKTRGGRGAGLALRQTDNSLLVVSNVADQSSTASMNVASPSGPPRKMRAPRQAQMRVSDCRSQRESRDKSGFAKCFSDSDDGEPQKQKKYFC